MMKRTTLRPLVAAGAALAATASMTAAAVGAEGEPPSYQEFKASTHVDTDGQYVVNGDEPVGSSGALRQFYDRMVATAKTGSQDQLVINTVNGRDDKWSASQAMNLTYCVSTKFGGDHSRVAKAAAAGTALWEQASTRVEFTHVASQDGNCTVRNNSVVFSVEPVRTTQYIARAFFPSTPKRQRNVLVVASSLFSSGSWTPANIMGHELGHTLGFRHEHTRPESGTCFEDNSWRPLTPYDAASIMHYPQCNGSSTHLSFSPRDGDGIRAVYGS